MKRIYINTMTYIFKNMKISRINLMTVLILFVVIGPSSAVDQIQDYDFDKYYDDLANSNFTLQNLTTVGAAPYENLFGSIFWGIVFGTIFIMLWISMEDVTIPALLGMIIGGSVWTLMPPEWVQIAMSLTVVSLAGLVYSLLKRGQS